MLLFQMSLPLYTLRLAGLFVALSCMSGSTLEMAASSSVAAGPYHKLPDGVECAPEHGENLNTHACYKFADHARWPWIFAIGYVFGSSDLYFRISLGS